MTDNEEFHSLNSQNGLQKPLNNIIAITISEGAIPSAHSCFFSGNGFSLTEIDPKELIQCDREHLLIILYCDFKCAPFRCFNRMLSASSDNRTAIVFVRELPLACFNPPMFALSLMNGNQLSIDQMHLLEHLKSSYQYVANLGYKVHPSDIINRLATLQGSIIEKPYGNYKLVKSARFARVSLSYLSRTFHKNTDITLHDFLIRNRMCNALYKVLSLNLMIKEIAFEEGYKLDTFSKMFKKTYGLSPIYLRRKLSDIRQKSANDNKIFRIDMLA